MSVRGSISKHLNTIKQRTLWIANQLKKINKFPPIRHMLQLWEKRISNPISPKFGALY